MDKPGAWFAQAETENYPREEYYVKMKILFLEFLSSSGVFLPFLLYHINYLQSWAKYLEQDREIQ